MNSRADLIEQLLENPDDIIRTDRLKLRWDDVIKTLIDHCALFMPYIPYLGRQGKDKTLGRSKKFTISEYRLHENSHRYFLTRAKREPETKDVGDIMTMVLMNFDKYINPDGSYMNEFLQDCVRVGLMACMKNPKCEETLTKRFRKLLVALGAKNLKGEWTFLTLVGTLFNEKSFLYPLLGHTAELPKLYSNPNADALWVAFFNYQLELQKICDAEFGAMTAQDVQKFYNANINEVLKLMRMTHDLEGKPWPWFHQAEYEPVKKFVKTASLKKHREFLTFQGSLHSGNKTQLAKILKVRGTRNRLLRFGQIAWLVDTVPDLFVKIGDDLAGSQLVARATTSVEDPKYLLCVMETLMKEPVMNETLAPSQNSHQYQKYYAKPCSGTTSHTSTKT